MPAMVLGTCAISNGYAGRAGQPSTELQLGADMGTRAEARRI
jgi:hypothetical protein